MTLHVYATVGPKPDPTECDVCADPTDGGSALCTKCAWDRYYDQLDDFWGKTAFGEGER